MTNRYGDEFDTPYSEDDPQFWVMDLNDANHADLNRSLSGLVGLVDEALGGIIAYVLPGCEESLLAHLNGS